MDFKTANWKEDRDELIDYLASIASEKYKNFSKGLIPGEFEMIGVNLPTLKKIANEIYRGDYEQFLEMDDANMFELKFLKGQVIANIKNVEEYEQRLWTYLPLITDWSLCDSFVAASKVIKKDKKRFFEIAKKLVKKDDEFDNRVGFVILLDYFVEEEYIDKIFALIADFRSEKYYAKMALAWLLSVMYVKSPDKTFDFLKTSNFEDEIIKLTIRKIRDSYRVSDENKERLRNLL